jgi:hypothetical protein
MELGQWHDRLHEHFKQLCVLRQNHPAKAPVFALEHDLGTARHSRNQTMMAFLLS